MKPIRRVIASAALTVLSVVLGLAIVELGLRAWYRHANLPQMIGQDLLDVWKPAPKRGWGLAPNVRTLSSQSGRIVPYETNSRGLRDVEHEYAKGTRRRIVVLGDSFMEAQQTALSETFAQRLQAVWPGEPIEVINLGVSGYGTIQEYLYLMEEGFRYQPDLVLLAFYSMNDVENNSRELSHLTFGRDSIQTFGRPYVKHVGVISDDNAEYPDEAAVRAYLEDRVARNAHAEHGPRWFENSYIYHFARLSLARMWPGEGDTRFIVLASEPNVLLGTMLTEFSNGQGNRGLPAQRYAAFFDRGWRTTEAHLQAIARECQARHCQFAVFSVPDRIQVDQKYRDAVIAEYPGLPLNTDLPNQVLEKFCSSIGIPFINLVPEFAAEQNKGPESMYLFDRHWGPRGHDLAARIVAGRLKDCFGDAAAPK